MKTKIALFFAALYVSFAAQAKMQKAELNVCSLDALGCVHTINISGKTFPVVVDPSAAKAARLTEKMIAVHQLLGLPKTAPFFGICLFWLPRVFSQPHY